MHSWLSLRAFSSASACSTIKEVRKLSDAFFSGVYAIPAGNNVLNAYEINIAGDVNIIVTMHYDDTGINEDSIHPYKFDGTSWFRDCRGYCRRNPNNNLGNICLCAFHKKKASKKAAILRRGLTFSFSNSNG